MLKTTQPSFISSRVLRKLSILGGLVAIAIVPVSCSVIDDEVAAIVAPVKERRTVEKVKRVNKSYAYNNVAVVTASLGTDVTAASATISAPFNRGAYTCSPSGFGQKSSCFLRQ